MKQLSLNRSVPVSTPRLREHRDSLLAFLEEERRRVEICLHQLVPAEDVLPPVIHRAMRYSLFAGGKRLRPILCLAAARMIAEGPVADAEAISSTIEMIHTYSLIHDDLPALDNDDLRRGNPTCHVQFGEATAILAGDGLLTLAFHILATLPHTPSQIRAHLIAELSQAAGTVDGMIGGQIADLEASDNAVSPAALEYIHRSKTAALFRASISMGAIAAEASEVQLRDLSDFGAKAGLAFQIVDDILDVESSSEKLGKSVGKDAAQKKVTYPALYGVARSRQMAHELLRNAKASLNAFGIRADRLNALADLLVFRKA
jgi:geranylgeranyl diphosphate synthase type II